MHYYCNHSIVKKKKREQPFCWWNKKYYYHIFSTLLLLYILNYFAAVSFFRTFLYTTTTTMCKTLYTYLTKLKEKRSSDSPNLFMPYFCGLIYFSNFSRPGSSPSNSSSRHRIGKCKLIYDTGYTSMGREIDFKILQYELVLDRMSLLITLDFNNLSELFKC